MAFQTSTSSPLAPTSSSNSTSTDPGGADLNARNSVPFSFLIAFLALFVVFMGLGLWARRIVFFARRRMGLPVPEQPQSKREARSKRPVLWDVYPDKHAQPGRWASVEPLSTWYCRDAPPPPLCEHTPVVQPGWPPNFGQPVPPALSRGPGRAIALAPPPLPSPSLPSPFARRSLRARFVPLDSLREWWLDLTNPMRHAPPKGADGAKGRIDSLQVAVFVAMPSRPAGQPRGLAQLGEMAIGIAATRWEHGEAVRDADETRT